MEVVDRYVTEDRMLRWTERMWFEGWKQGWHEGYQSVKEGTSGGWELSDTVLQEKRRRSLKNLLTRSVVERFGELDDTARARLEEAEEELLVRWYLNLRWAQYPEDVF